MPTKRTGVDLTAVIPTTDALTALREATLSGSYVSLGTRRTNTPHEYYRYPARFSPAFARRSIEAFTRRGDLVLDPFVGGGTTLVEAMASGRRSVGSDLNTLATFVSAVKTTPLTADELSVLRAWIRALPDLMSKRNLRVDFSVWEERGYFKDLDDDLTRPLQATIARALTAVEMIRFTAPNAFARCIVLRTAQWALDMRREVPSVDEFLTELHKHADGMVAVAELNIHDGSNLQPRVLTQRLPGLADAYDDTALPDLILTSPPYPGVYVLYHRWKLRGRREIPAPYWIANRQDGHGMARYTMSARSEPTQRTYFEQLEESFADLATLAKPSTWLVQVVGFNGGTPQLDRYLEAMEAAGFEERRFDELSADSDGRLWRDVPNRRWWTEATSMKGVAAHTAREVVLFHQPSN